MSPTPPNNPVCKFFYDLCYRRERLRQFVGIVLVIVLTFLGKPIERLYYVGVVLAVFGLLFRLWASGYLKKDHELATDGTYRFVRHPLYVGNIAVSLGFCFASGLWWSFPAVLVFWLAFIPPAIKQEDAKLERLFGDDFRAWKKEIKALVPRLKPYAKGSPGQWSFRQSFKANGEPIYAVVLGAFLVYLFTRLG